MTNNLETDVLSDDTLIGRIQRGDFSAFDELIERHLGQLRTFIALKSPASSLVDEIAHEAFVFAFRNMSVFEVGTSFRAWLRSIAWNLLRAEMQRFSREQVNQARFADYERFARGSATYHTNSSDEAEFLEECFQSLPEGMRELLQLKYREGFSVDEIGQRQKRSLVWVRTVLFRLRQQLKTCIDQKMGETPPC